MHKHVIEIDFYDPLEDCLNILMVEDDPTDAELIKEQVRALWPDGKVMAVSSLQDAYAAFKNHKINLFLLDLNLPDGMGPATVAEVRRFNKKIPVVVITGMGTDLTVKEALRLGANHVVLKSSITDPDFLQVLKESIALNA
jgi:two-component system repressor protein LuxO